MFITFEGPEGAGKSTQAALLAGALENRGLQVVLTREPGGTALGDRIRNVLLNEPGAVSAEAEAYLMTGARAEHVRQVINPALKSGFVVICDRFVDSTLAYQGAGRGLELSTLKDLQTLAVGDLVPNLTILMDIDVVAGLARKSEPDGRNKLDDEPLEFHEKVLAWYRAAASSDPDRWQVINASYSQEEVHQRVLDCVELRLADGANAGHEG